MMVNGLPLPDDLVRAIEDGSWPPESDVETIERVFADSSEGPEFWDLAGIIAINKRWRIETDQLFTGQPGTSSSVDPARSLLIGQLGYDQLVALSYPSYPRESGSPSVVYLEGASRINDELVGHWRPIASGIADLLARLRRQADDEI